MGLEVGLEDEGKDVTGRDVTGLVVVGVDERAVVGIAWFKKTIRVIY